MKADDRRLPPASEAQERVDACFYLRGGTGGIDARAVSRFLLVICGCLLIPLNCAAEAPALPERQHLQVQIGVDRVESSALQQRDAKSIGDGVPFVAAILGEREPIAEKSAYESAGCRPAGGCPRAGEHFDSNKFKWHWSHTLIASVLGFLLGFAITYR